MRLFRQRQHGDWSGIVDDVRSSIPRPHLTQIQLFG